MFIKFIKSLTGTAQVATPTCSNGPSPFSYLDLVERGFADRAHEFVLTGEERSILSDLTDHSKINANYQPGQLDRAGINATNALCYTYGGQPEQLARYAALRLAMAWGLRTTISKDLEHLGFCRKNFGHACSPV